MSPEELVVLFPATVYKLLKAKELSINKYAKKAESEFGNIRNQIENHRRKWTML